MYDIVFYKDKQGNEPVYDYLRELASSNSKNSRIKLNKIQMYIQMLSTNGTFAGEPYVKHLDGDIWELRPLRDRILFAAWNEERKSFVLLHHFMKKTQKTPKNEIELAKKEYADFIDRS